MPKRIRTILAIVGLALAVVVPGGFVVPALIALIVAAIRRKTQPAAPKEQ